MASSPTIVGDNTVIWGTSGVYDSGYIISGSKEITSLEEAVKDKNGFTVTKIYYDNYTEYQFDMAVGNDSGIPDLTVGEFITILSDTDAIMEKSVLKYSNKGVAVYSVTARAYSQIAAS